MFASGPVNGIGEMEEMLHEENVAKSNIEAAIINVFTPAVDPMIVCNERVARSETANSVVPLVVLNRSN